MKTYAELQAEVARLNQLGILDESGLAVRMVTLIALEWVLGLCPVSPSARLLDVQEELVGSGELLDGVIDIGGVQENGEGN